MQGSERRSAEFGVWNPGRGMPEGKLWFLSGFGWVSCGKIHVLDERGAVCPCVEGDVVMLSCSGIPDYSTAAFSTFFVGKNKAN